MALLGSQEHSHELDVFQSALAAGQLLLMVDIDRRRDDAVQAAILRHPPQATIGSAALFAGQEKIS